MLLNRCEGATTLLLVLGAGATEPEGHRGAAVVEPTQRTSQTQTGMRTRPRYGKRKAPDKLAYVVVADVVRVVVFAAAVVAAAAAAEDDDAVTYDRKDL